MKTSPWWLALRPQTLLASLSPIVLGSCLAFYDGSFRTIIFLLALICALSLQIAVNLANDISDAHSGVDTPERLGPLRVTQSGLISEAKLKTFLASVVALAILSGALLVAYSHWVLLLFGCLSIAAVFAYSGGPWPLASHALGEVFVFLFFGLLAVGGSYFAHALAINLKVLGFASIVGLLSANIMLVNNIRDIKGDSKAGKNTLAVRVGENTAKNLYRTVLLAALSLHLLVAKGWGWLCFLPPLVCLPFGWQLYREIATATGRRLNILLKKSAILEAVYCALSGVILLFSSYF